MFRSVLLFWTVRAYQSTSLKRNFATEMTSIKELIIIRHGQAQHNPRAEVARANGCSMEEFIALMREDDVLDAALTPLGREQAKAARLSPEISKQIQLVVSSSLSRSLETADHIFPPSESPSLSQKRVCVENFREVNGDMLNARRRTKSELMKSFPSWNFDALEGEEDTLWTPVMEDLDVAAERGYVGLQWLLKRPETSIMLVCHGGILRYMMTLHPLVVLKDERSRQNGKSVESRFDNCEIRRYRICWGDDAGNSDVNGRRPIVLTQVDD